MKTPKFISDLKKQTIMTTDRSKLYVRPQREKREKLQAISIAEGVSEQKLVELAIDLLWEKYSRAQKAG